jgi:hypothetical protein
MDKNYGIKTLGAMICGAFVYDALSYETYSCCGYKHMWKELMQEAPTIGQSEQSAIGSQIIYLQYWYINHNTANRGQRQILQLQNSL